MNGAVLAHAVRSHLIRSARALTHPRAFATHRLSCTHSLTVPHPAPHYFRVHYEATAPTLGRDFYSQRRLLLPNKVMFTPISTRRRQPERGAKSQAARQHMNTQKSKSGMLSVTPNSYYLAM